jgi:UrcA family protein
MKFTGRKEKPTHTGETAMFTTSMSIFALALSSQLANAGPPPDARSVTVQFADLDLWRSEGATVLYQRLKGAAETVCAPLDERNLAMQMRFKACVQSAISTAVAKIDRPALTGYYEAKSVGGNATTHLAQK